MMTPTQHEKNEWSRMAQDAYSKDRNDIGTEFSAAASILHDQSVSTEWFDDKMKQYREWLVFGNFKPKQTNSTQTTSSKITKRAIGLPVKFHAFNGATYGGKIESLKNGVCAVAYEFTNEDGIVLKRLTAYVDLLTDRNRIEIA